LVAAFLMQLARLSFKKSMRLHCEVSRAFNLNRENGMAADIGVGVIGFGLATRVFHAPFVSAVPGLRLHAIVERSGNAAQAAYPNAGVVRSVEELLGDSAVSLVVVATPNETHYRLARQALLAGKHVVIDKPFAATSAEARDLIEIAVAGSLVLAPFHNRRWDGDFLTVRKLLADGSLGRLVTFESHFDRYRPILREGTWKEAGGNANGLLMDLGPHLVDQVVALFGMPKTITASVRTDRDNSRIEDAFDIALGYDGLLAWCRSSMLACDASPRFLLHGTAGSYKKYGLDPQEPAIVAGAKVPRMGEGEWLMEPEAAWGTLTVAPALVDPETLVKTVMRTEPGDYRSYYANVRDAILGKSPLAVPSEAGYNVIRLLELARVSSAECNTIAI
jgi:scyllo-inositol 2-dehydrogenase (NADP+)